MGILETIGMLWVILSSSLASVGVIYFAYIGLKATFSKEAAKDNADVPVEVKEMFKIAR